MGIGELIVSQTGHNGHGALELVNQVFEFGLDGVDLEGLFKSLGDLVVLLGGSLDSGGVDFTEVSLYPLLGELFPLL